ANWAAPPAGGANSSAARWTGSPRNWDWTRAAMNNRGETTRRDRDLPDRLAQLWRTGQRPDLAAFLAGAGTLPAGELVAVLRVDQEARWRAGERVGAEHYLDAHPAL